MTRIRTLAAALTTVGMLGAAPVEPATATLLETSTASAVSERPAAWMVIQVWKHHRTELRVIDAEGRKVSQPASNVDGGDQTNPDWSPDGQTLTFGMVGDDGRDDLWTVGVDGSSPHRLYDCTGECSYIDDPAWSPTARRSRCASCGRSIAPTSGVLCSSTSLLAN